MVEEQSERGGDVVPDLEIIMSLQVLFISPSFSALGLTFVGNQLCPNDSTTTYTKYKVKGM